MVVVMFRCGEVVVAPPFQIVCRTYKKAVNFKTEMKIDSASETGIRTNGTKGTKRFEINAEAFVRMANELVARSSDDAV